MSDKQLPYRAPRYLSKESAALWNKLAAELFDNNRLTPANSETLAMLCQTYGEYKAATAVLEKEGRYIVAGTGALKLHPANAAQKTASDTFTRLAAELLLTPKSQSKTPKPLAGEVLDDYFAAEGL